MERMKLKYDWYNKVSRPSSSRNWRGERVHRRDSITTLWKMQSSQMNGGGWLRRAETSVWRRKVTRTFKSFFSEFQKLGNVGTGN